jgi:hypothetical protein
MSDTHERITTDEMTPEEKELVAAIVAALAGRSFDTTTNLAIVETDRRLTAALDALVPVGKYNSSRLRYRRIHRALEALADRNMFDVDRFGWWSIRGLAIHAG